MNKTKLTEIFSIVDNVASVWGTSFSRGKAEHSGSHGRDMTVALGVLATLLQ